MSEKPVLEWRNKVKPVLDSKRKEFFIIGYSKTTNDDIWDCLVDRIWEGNPNKRLHEVVQDILHLTSSVYMNYLTLSTYQDDDLMESINALIKNSDT